MKDSSFTSLSKIQGTMHRAVVGYFRTKDFIKAIRRCKTNSEERALLAREAASIRNALKNPNISADHRYHSLGKLVVMHLLGYPVLFGQVECMKLAASIRKSTGKPRLNHKRLGYLGTSLLVDGEQCTLPLICNTIKSDLVSGDAPIMAMAANALALFASGSGEIGQEMLPQILDLLASRSLHHEVRKRLTACAAQMVRSCPDLGELFVESKRGNRPVLAPCLDTLLSDRNEGTLLASCELLLTLLDNEDVGDIIREECKVRILPNLLRVLDTVRKAAPPEYDVAGIPDPFLQCKLIKLFTKIAKNDRVASEVIASSLLDVMSSTSISIGSIERYVSVALILECCKSLLRLPCPPSAHDAASRQLLDLLANSAQCDSTVRYVILKSICELRDTSLSDLLTLHRGQLLGALKDSSGMEWALKSKIISLSLVNLTVNNYQIVLDQISQVLQDESFYDTISVMGQIVGVLEHLPLKNGAWLGNFLATLFVNGEDDESEQVWMIVSRVIDLIDRHFLNPSVVTIPDCSNKSKYLKAVAYWTMGESLKPGIEKPPLSSYTDFKLFGYYIGAVGKQAVKFPELVDDALTYLKEIAMNGPMECVERAVETANILSSSSSFPPFKTELYNKRINDHVMIYSDQALIADTKTKENGDEECLIKVQRLENEKGHYEVLLKRANVILELECKGEMTVSKVSATHWLLVKPILPLSLFLYSKSIDTECLDGWERNIAYITELPIKQENRKQERKMEVDEAHSSFKKSGKQNEVEIHEKKDEKNEKSPKEKKSLDNGAQEEEEEKEESLNFVAQDEESVDVTID